MKKTEELVLVEPIIDPKEYNLEIDKSIKIQESFLPKVTERDSYIADYEEIVNAEISIDTCNKANELRKKLVKVRTGIAEVHTIEKAFFYQAGKFVDALKNKLTLPVTQMEEKLKSIQDYYDNIERERIAKIVAERNAKVADLSEFIPSNLDFAKMSDEDFTKILNGAKMQKDLADKEASEAEEKRIEAERIEKLGRERKFLLIPYWAFVPEGFKSLNMGMATEMEFRSVVEEAKADRKAKEEADRKAKAEAEKQAKLIAQREAEAKKEREAREKAEAELKAKNEAEAKAKAEAEAKAKADQKAKEEADRKAKAAPDKDKLMQFARMIEAIELPELATKEVKDILLSENESLLELVKRIKVKASNL